MSAVSARPLRAPWVEMKYCSTSRPSRKLAVIGVSMIEPIGLGHQTTHTGELANLRGRATGAGVGHHVDGVEGLLLDVLALASLTISVPSLSIIALATCSLVYDQMSTTLL